MPRESYIENNVAFERKWHRFSKVMWVVLLLWLAASAAGLNGGGGPLARRTERSPDLAMEYERVARARSVAKWLFHVEAPKGEARLTLRGGIATRSTLRDISPQPKSMIAGRDALTLVYDVEPGSAATIRINQALHSPGRLRSTVEAGRTSFDIEQTVFP